MIQRVLRLFWPNKNKNATAAKNDSPMQGGVVKMTRFANESGAWRKRIS
jgi:hypothetical protein